MEDYVTKSIVTLRRHLKKKNASTWGALKGEVKGFFCQEKNERGSYNVFYTFNEKLGRAYVDFYPSIFCEESRRSKMRAFINKKNSNIQSGRVDLLEDNGAVRVRMETSILSSPLSLADVEKMEELALGICLVLEKPLPQIASGHGGTIFPPPSLDDEDDDSFLSGISRKIVWDSVKEEKKEGASGEQEEGEEEPKADAADVVDGEHIEEDGEIEGADLRKRKELFEIPDESMVPSSIRDIVQDFPNWMIVPDPPSKLRAEELRRIYEENCFCFDEIGQLFVQKCLEYAATHQTRPIILYGGAGGGKSHRAQVFAKMMGLYLYRRDIPLVAHGTSLSGEGGSWKDASLGYIADGMYQARSANYVFLGEEIDKEERAESRVSFSMQFLKALDQDATQFYDNRLKFNVDASHIVFCFTANDREKINPVFANRCDVLEIPFPSQQEIEIIVRRSIIPRAIEAVRAYAEVSFAEEAVTRLLQDVWMQQGAGSVREYQKIVEKCVAKANTTSICEERPVIIGAADVVEQLRNNINLSAKRKRIGFE